MPTIWYLEIFPMCTSLLLTLYNGKYTTAMPYKYMTDFKNDFEDITPGKRVYFVP